MNDLDLLGLLAKEKGIWALVIFYVIKTVLEFARDKGKELLKTALENKQEVASMRTEMNNRFDKLTADMNTAFLNIKKIREKTEMGVLEIPKIDQ